MPEILSFYPNRPELEKENLFKSLWEDFKSSDRFTKFFIITFILIILATPFIISNYQLIVSRGESEAQRLRSIAQIQEFQQSFINMSSSTANVEGAPVSAIKQTISPMETVSTFFMNSLKYLFKTPISFFTGTGAR